MPPFYSPVPNRSAAPNSSASRKNSKNLRPTELKVMFTVLRPRHVCPAAFKTRFFGFHVKIFVFFLIFRHPSLELSSECVVKRRDRSDISVCLRKYDVYETLFEQELLFVFVLFTSHFYWFLYYDKHWTARQIVFEV